MLRDRSIVALLSAELISRFGSQLTYLALPWFVLVTTGSPTEMGLVIAGALFVAIGLHATYALIAVLATLASLNFIVVAPRFSLVQETA